MIKSLLMKSLIIALVTILFLLVAPFSWAGGKSEKNTEPVRNTYVLSSSEVQPVPPPVSVSPFYIGDGGKGMSIAILAPQSSGLAVNQGYLPALVQGEFVSNFSRFSAISILDRQRLDDQYTELFSGYYSDNAEALQDLGHLTPTTHIMGGSITRTATGYALQIQITKTTDKMTTASYSGTFTFAELDNLTGIRRASLELLQKMGITLTSQAQRELTLVATINHVNAQTALAQGITAQRQGTEVAALSYYLQAAAFDPSLLEASNRSSIINANISGSNLGHNIRNDIQWRRDWVARLTETEQFFNTFNRTQSMPYTLFYSNEIKWGTINYQNETVTLSIETNLVGNVIWANAVERALQTVYDCLGETGRKNDWGLANWPWQGVTNLNPFTRRNANFFVVIEIVNNQNKVIGRQTLQVAGFWEFYLGVKNHHDRPSIIVSAEDYKVLNFLNVNANEISDNLTIRIASVNGTDAATASRNGVLQIQAVNKIDFDMNMWRRFRFENGEIKGFANNVTRPQILIIPNNILNVLVTSISDNAFKNNQLTRVIIGNNITSIGGIPSRYVGGAFEKNQLTSVIIGNSVLIIGSYAFEGNQLTSVTIPDSVTTIGYCAFENNQLTSVIIGNSVTTIGGNAFANNQLTSVTIPNSVTTIGGDGLEGGAFEKNQLTSVIIGNRVTTIGGNAFANNQLTSVTIPNSVTFIGVDAFGGNKITRITIGSNVRLNADYIGGGMAFDDRFDLFYINNNKKAGRYTKSGNTWTYSP
jgi:hypothetical protein